MEQDRRHFIVRAERSGAWWALSVPDIDGAFSQVKRLDQAEAVGRDLIALMAEIPEDSFDLQIVPAFEEVDAKLVNRYRSARSKADAAQTTSREALSDVVRRLREEGYSMRDIAFALGLSFQRVSQIAASWEESTDEERQWARDQGRASA